MRLVVLIVLIVIGIIIVSSDKFIRPEAIRALDMTVNQCTIDMRVYPDLICD